MMARSTKQTRTSPLLGVLADPLRQHIVSLLAESARSVSDLASFTPVSASAVSQHLRLLKDQGLVTERKSGRQRIYSVCPQALDALARHLLAMRDQALVAEARATNKDPADFDQIDYSLEQWAETWEELDPLAIGIIVRMRMVARDLERLSRRSAARFGLSSAQVLLLATLDRPETPLECNLTELARICHISLPATARHIEQCAQGGLISRRQDEYDGRIQLIRITAGGRDLIHQVLRQQRLQDHTPVYVLSASDRMQLARILRRLQPALQRALDSSS